MSILFNYAIRWYESKEVEDTVGTYDIAELLEKSIFGEQTPPVEEAVEEQIEANVQ